MTLTQDAPPSTVWTAAEVSSSRASRPLADGGASPVISSPPAHAGASRDTTPPGWPATRRTRPSAPLGWPSDVATASAPAHAPVSRETGTAKGGEAAVSRETDTREAPTPSPVEVPQPSAADTVTTPPQDGTAVTAAPARPFRTAGELAGLRGSGDRSTPLARSVEHALLVREGRQVDGLPRPARTRVMVVANQKGGVGKTTSTVNLAAALAQGGLRVLVVDLDPQGNASTALAVDHHRGTPSVYDVVVDGVPLADVVTESTEVSGLFVAPATIDLAGAEIELVSMVAREGRLRRALHAHPWVFGTDEDRFDYVLIDCPPSLGLLTLNALVAGEEMMIPIQAEYYALEGLGQLLETVEMVRAHLNPDLVVSTIMLTMYDARTRLSAGVAEEVRSHFADQVLRTAIPRSVRISEAPSYGQTVMTYDPGSPGALSYLEAAREIALAVLRRATAADGATPTHSMQGASA